MTPGFSCFRPPSQWPDFNSALVLGQEGQIITFAGLEGINHRLRRRNQALRRGRILMPDLRSYFVLEGAELVHA